MTETTPDLIPAVRLNRYTNPVLYARKSRNLYHVPHISRAGERPTAYPVCNGLIEYLNIESLDVFRRRRNAEICAECDRQTPGDGYPDTAPVGDSI